MKKIRYLTIASLLTLCGCQGTTSDTTGENKASILINGIQVSADVNGEKTICNNPADKLTIPNDQNAEVFLYVNINCEFLNCTDSFANLNIAVCFDSALNAAVDAANTADIRQSEILHTCNLNADVFTARFQNPTREDGITSITYSFNATPGNYFSNSFYKIVRIYAYSDDCEINDGSIESELINYGKPQDSFHAYNHGVCMDCNATELTYSSSDPNQATGVKDESIETLIVPKYSDTHYRTVNGTVNDKKSVSIANEAFTSLKNLKKAYIKTDGDYGMHFLYGCENLEYLSIGHGGYYSSSLTGDELPLGYYFSWELSDSTFKKYRNDLASFNKNVPASLKEVAVETSSSIFFDGCENVKKVTFTGNMGTGLANSSVEEVYCNGTADFNGAENIKKISFHSITTDTFTELFDYSKKTNTYTGEITYDYYIGCPLETINYYGSSDIPSSYFGKIDSLKTIRITNARVINEKGLYELANADIYLPKTLTTLGLNALPDNAKIYYEGTEEEWNSIEKQNVYNNVTFNTK